MATDESSEPRRQVRVGKPFIGALRNGETVEIIEVAHPSCTISDGTASVWRHLGYRLVGGVRSLESWDTQGYYDHTATEHLLDIIEPRLHPLD